jgi:hypothetical protein
MPFSGVLADTARRLRSVRPLRARVRGTDLSRALRQGGCKRRRASAPNESVVERLLRNSR